MYISPLPFKTGTGHFCDTFNIAQEMGGNPKYQLSRDWMKGQLYSDEVKGQVKTCLGELIAPSVIVLGSPIFLHKEDWQTDKEIHAKQLWRAPFLCL